jgi:hypothetical protein
MIKKEFFELTKAERAVILLKSGSKMSGRNMSGFDIFLFLLEDFFAELWYHENTNRIVKIEVVENDLILQNYPDLIDMPQISEILIEK